MVVPEPLGGAHRNIDDMAKRLKSVLIQELQSLQQLSLEKLIEQRYQKFMAMGACD
jgi:acetyl-CoA carboxylase carboxyl transferase subunit alpha